MHLSVKENVRREVRTKKEGEMERRDEE